MNVKQGKSVASKGLKIFPGISFLMAMALVVLFCSLPLSGEASPLSGASYTELSRKAAAGDREAMVELGMRYDYGQKGAPRDLGKAILWYRKAAVAGDPSAMMLLSQRYEIGRGVPLDDRKSLRWLLKAARKGYPPAEDELGDRYAGGRGVPQDDKLALHWYLRAGSHGYGESQDLLGERYEAGQGVPKNLEKAAYWYLRAAKDAGNPDAFARLGRFSEKGLGGMKKSPVEAWFWYSMAKDTSLSARKALDRLGARLTDAEKTRAWKMKTEFLARYRSRWNRWVLRP